MAFALLLLFTCGSVQAGAFGRRAAAVTVASDPPEAMVFLDDCYVGLTPVALPARNKGKHLLRVERYGYQPVVQAVDLSSASPVLRVELRRVLEGSLQVVSDPDDAEVWLDGELEGSTPLTLDGVAAGEHEVRLIRISYEPWVGTVAVEPGKTAQLRSTLVQRSEDYYLSRLKAEPDNAILVLELAHVRLVRGDFDGAIQCYEKAVEALVDERGSPRSGKAFQEIEKVYTGQVNYGGDEAVRTMQRKLQEMLQRLADKYPQRAELCQALARYYERAGQPAKAAEVFERLADRVPGNLSAFLSAGEQYIAAGQPDRAIAVYQKAAQVHSGNHLIFERLAQAYVLQYQGGNPAAKELAIAAFRKALELCRDVALKRRIQRSIDALTGTQPQ